jgi:hypothetical protein
MTRPDRMMLVVLSLLTGAGMAGCSSGGTPTVAQGVPGLPATSVPAPGIVKDWVVKWCEAQPGISKAQLVTIMGKPTEASDGQSSRWQGYGWQFNAFYDTAGNAQQLDVNEYGLSSVDRASLSCETTRTSP